MSKAHVVDRTDGRARRESPRILIEVAVDWRSEHNFYTGLTQNISEGGLFVATNQLKPIGSRIQVRFSLPGIATPIAVETEVRWVREATALKKIEGGQGMGLRFLDLPPEAAAAVRSFLRGRESLFYDED